MRQLTGPAAIVLQAQTFDPYGNLYASGGVGGSAYGFTGEYQDPSGLLFLRARYYNPAQGRFLQMDPSRQEMDLYEYGLSAPVVYADPSGLRTPPDPGGPITVLARLLVSQARFAYSKQGSNRNCAALADDGQDDVTDTIDDLFTDFICEYGPDHRTFGHDARLTQELARSTSIARHRAMFYYSESLGYQEYVGEGQMGPAMFLGAKIIDLPIGYTQTRFMGIDNVPVTIVDYLGGYDWRIYKTGRGTVRFEISDTKNLSSGTRIGFTRTGATDISLEDYFSNPSRYNRDGSTVADVTHIDLREWNVISVLSDKPAAQRNPDDRIGIGGGEMMLKFVWEEKYIQGWSCDSFLTLPLPFGLLPAEES